MRSNYNFTIVGDTLVIKLQPKHDVIAGLLIELTTEFSFNHVRETCHKVMTGEIDAEEVGKNQYRASIMKDKTTVYNELNFKLIPEDQESATLTTADFKKYLDIWWSGYNYWKETGKVPKAGSIS